MKRRDFVVVAGLQPEIMSRLATEFEKRNEELVPLRSLRCPSGYTESYVSELYERVANELKKLVSPSRKTLFHNANLTLLYVDRPERPDDALLDKFGVEALPVPLGALYMAPTRTSNQMGNVVNRLIKTIRQAMARVRALRWAIGEEVTNRDNRTCLLLPPKAFGRGFQTVRKHVYAAARNGEGPDEIGRRLKQLRNTIPVKDRKYFVGDKGLVFICPAKAADRHALAPLWGDDSHNASCVIRGRLRFGVSFDPRFHYDCDFGSRRTVTLPGCHKPRTVSRKRPHVNVAPNDHVR